MQSLFFGTCFAFLMLSGCTGTRQSASGSEPAGISDGLSGKNQVLLTEILEYLAPAGESIRDSLWFEAEVNLDSALEKVKALKGLDSLDSNFYSVLDLYKDSIYSLLIQVTAQTTKMETAVPWSAFLDHEMEMVSDSQMVAIGSIIGHIDPRRYSIPISLPLQPRVIQAMVVLTSSGKGYFSKWLNRRSKYRKIIEEQLAASGLPREIIYLAMVESGFSPSAWSKAKASGLWQFIAPTGKRYGLEYNWWVDERRDPVKSTKAAISYLQDLYAEFQDWKMAFAGYNCGEGRVRRILRGDSSLSYWDMELPKETMNYVPKILAAMIIGEEPEKYGFLIDPEPSIEFDTVTVFYCLSLDVIADISGTSVDNIKALNPELRRWCTPPDVKEYLLKLPRGSRDKFLAAYDKLDKNSLVSWHHHVISSGENLGAISRKYGVPVQAIKTTNNLRGNLIRAGQTLLIPISGEHGSPKASSENKPRKKDQAAAAAGGIYVVKSGDNIYDIANIHGISMTGLLQANQLNHRSVIKPGQRLVIPRFSGTAGSDAGINESDASEDFKIHRVRAGENLSVISRKLDISISQLMDWNQLRSHDISIGQELKYKPVKSEKAPVYYIVKSSDNLWDIARKFNTSISNIEQLNPDLPKVLKPGMKIRIK